MQLDHRVREKVRGFVLFLALAMILLARLTRFIEPDFFMHLRVGQWILENRTVPRIDVFSHVAEGLPWTDHEWLFQVLLYGLHKLGGWPLLALSRCALLTLSYYITYKTCRLVGLRFSLAVAMTLIVAGMSMGSVEFRPQVITYVLFPFFFYLMLKHLLGHSSRLWLMPVLIVPWANMHGAFVAVFVLGAVLILAEIAKHLAPRCGLSVPGTLVPPKRLLKLSGTLLITFMATILNPYGTEMWFFPFKVVQHPIFFTMIFEWMPPEFPFFTPFWVVLGISIVIITLGWRNIDFRNTLLFLVWSYFSLSARRNIVLFGYVAAPIFGQMLMSIQDVVANWGQKHERWHPVLRRSVEWIVYIYTVWLIWAVGQTVVNQTVNEWGIGIHSEVPEAMADFILRHKPAGQIYNEYNIGGYLIYRLYPYYKVFQDGRVDVYGPKLFLMYKIIESGNNLWRKAVKDHNLNVFILTYGGVKYPGNLASQLDDDPEWDLVHFDDSTIIYFRNSGPNRRLARQLRYEVIKPGYQPDTYLTNTDVLTSAVKELDRAIANVPKFRQARMLKIYCLSALGRFEEAEKEAQALAEISGNVGEVWRVRGRVASYLHKYDDALSMLQKAAEIQPSSLETWRNLGEVYEVKGEHEKALQAFLRAASLSKATDVSAYVSVARVATRLGNDKLAIKYWEKYLELHPTDATALNDAGTLCLRNRQYDRAITLFKRAAEAAPDNPAPYYNLACVYSAVGQTDRALMYLKLAISLGGETIAAIAKQDTDIKSLHSNPAFETTIRDIPTTAGTRHDLTTATLIRTVENE